MYACKEMIAIFWGNNKSMIAGIVSQSKQELLPGSEGNVPERIEFHCFHCFYGLSTDCYDLVCCS